MWWYVLILAGVGLASYVLGYWHGMERSYDSGYAAGWHRRGRILDTQREVREWNTIRDDLE